MLLVVAVVLVVVLLLLMPPTQDLLRKYLVDPFSPHYPDEVHMEIERTLTIDASGSEVTSYHLDLPKPVSVVEDGIYLQKVERLTASPHYDELWDNGTYDTMVWEGQNLQGALTVTVSIEVTQKLHVWNLDEDSVLDRDDIPQRYLDSYLDDQWRIVVDDPAIEALREEIVGDEENVYLIAKAIYDWVDDNVDYYIWPSTDGPLSSLDTYEERKGDCDDQSILFCALARSAGVPAWLQLGSIYDKNNDILGGHAWVQMFMPTEDGGSEVIIDIVNDRFLVWMPFLFCEYTDTGDADDLRNAYYHIRYSMPNSSPMPYVNEEWNMVDYEESGETVTLSALIAREDL